MSLEFCQFTSDNDWAKLCIETVMSNNDIIKPNIARMMFDSYPVQPVTSTASGLPFECVSNPGNYMLDDFLLYQPESDELVPNEAKMFQPQKCVDPVTTMISTITSTYNKKPRDPELDVIDEESSFDIEFANDTLHYCPTTARKRQQFRDRKQSQHYRKIEASINQMSGIYKAELSVAQEDNGANRTCTNNKRLLVNFKNIQPYPIQGVGPDGPAVHCTGEMKMEKCF